VNAAQLSLILGITIPALLLAGCATSVPVGDGGFGVPLAVPDTAVAQGDDVASYRVTLGVRNIEYGTITFDAPEISSDSHDVVIDDYRLRYRTGTAAIGFNFDLSSGEYDEYYDSIGFGFGIDGTPLLASKSDVSPILDYDATLSLDYSEEGVTTLVYAELFGRIGGGVDIQDFQLSTGLASSLLWGVLDSTPNRFSFDTHRITGVNLGGYVRAAYAAAGSPLFVEMIGFAGDLSGLTINGGFRF